MPAPIAVVITTYNRCPILEKTLDALAVQTHEDFRVVVVDDGSSDGTWPWLEERATAEGPRIVAVRQENTGQGQARNHGLRHVEEELVLFLGDDIIPGPDLVAEHLAVHACVDGSCAVVGFIDWRRGEMKVTPALEMVNREGHQFGFAHMTPGGEVPFTCFYTSNVSLPRAALGPAPFDAVFRQYGWEDVELGFRLSRQGVKMIYNPAAAAEHLHPMDLSFLFERQRVVGRGFKELLELHAELADSPLLSPPEPPRWFGLGKWLIPPFVPLLNTVDGWGVPLSRGLLHRVLICGYYLGREEEG